MQHDLFRSCNDLDLKSNFQNDLLTSYYSSFDASEEDKYDAGKMTDHFLIKLIKSYYIFSLKTVIF